MARKKKAEPKNWLKTTLVYVFIPLIVWSLAFFGWLYWDDITKLFFRHAATDGGSPRATRMREKSDKSSAPTKRSDEKISDDDRKKLDDILKKRQ
jgi:hypothetical protein